MLRRFYSWKVVGNIGLHFARSVCSSVSTLPPEMLALVNALGTKLSRTNFDWGKSPPPSKIKAVCWLTRIDPLSNE